MEMISEPSQLRDPGDSNKDKDVSEGIAGESYSVIIPCSPPTTGSKLQLSNGSLAGSLHNLTLRSAPSDAATGSDQTAESSPQPNHQASVDDGGSCRGGTEANPREEEDEDNEDWETNWDADLHKITPPPKEPPLLPSSDRKAASHAQASKVKQRGRGTFRFGSLDMYSDRLGEEDGRWASSEVESGVGLDRLAGDAEDESQREGAAKRGWSGNVPYRAAHVVEVYGFCPSVTTSDLESLVKPYGKDGVAIRWLDDTHALAVFHSPSIAQKALAEISDPRFKLRAFSEESESASLVKGKELEVPVPRPPTSARTARRMIASALQDCVGAQTMRALAKAGMEAEKREEAERKMRLTMRRQLRDEAWGED